MNFTVACRAAARYKMTSGLAAKPARHTAGPSSAQPLYMLLLQADIPVT